MWHSLFRESVGGAFQSAFQSWSFHSLATFGAFQSSFFAQSSRSFHSSFQLGSCRLYSVSHIQCATEKSMTSTLNRGMVWDGHSNRHQSFFWGALLRILEKLGNIYWCHKLSERSLDDSMSSNSLLVNS